MKGHLIVFITEVYRLQSLVFQLQCVMQSFVGVQISVRPLLSLNWHLKADVDAENKQ